ncbi:MAG: alpha/beta hydrolase [Deltaproteobacteria bacterium]|nr:MAG: alpha/beta hydrolase [Deltaproteobacteria bacterium]
MTPGGPPVAEWRLDRGALSLRVLELAAGHGPPVVCLHGFLDQAAAWTEVAAAIPGRRILALDQRGFGRSDPTPAGTGTHFPDYVADLDALVEALGGGPIDLVGHSMGGTVAGWYAGARPDRVRRLCLVEGLGPMAPGEDSALDRLRLYLDGLRRPPRVPVLRDCEHAAARLRRRHPGLSPALARVLARQGTVPTADGARRWSFDRMHLVRSPTPFREAWFCEALAAITAPTLVVWATDGWYGDEVQARRVAAIGSVGGAPVRRRTLAGGHMLLYDNPVELGRCIAAHLAARFADPRQDGPEEGSGGGEGTGRAAIPRDR